MPSNDPLSNVAIVLNEPKDVVNIAGVVRVMMNMGLRDLRFANPDEFDRRRIDGIAHRSRHILEAARTFDSLADALADATYVVGTSARSRNAQINAKYPRTLASEVVARALEGRVAILFGREDRGLPNEALDLCHEVAVIPTDPDFSSLNLAQACLVVCYEIFLARGAFESEDSLGRGKRARLSSVATQADLEEMYAVLQRGLDRVGFFSAREPATVLRTLRTLIGRAEPSLREARMVRAIGFEIERHLDRVESDDE